MGFVCRFLDISFRVKVGAGVEVGVGFWTLAPVLRLELAIKSGVKSKRERWS